MDEKTKETNEVDALEMIEGILAYLEGNEEEGFEANEELIEKSICFKGALLRFRKKEILH